MFKLTFVFCAIFAAVSADFDQIRQQCQAELDIPEESINNFKNWNFDNDDHAACYIECFFKKMGLATDGQFNVDKIAQTLASEDKSVDDLKPEIENCIDNSIADSCQRIFKGFKCFWPNNFNLIKAATKNL